MNLVCQASSSLFLAAPENPKCSDHICFVIIYFYLEGLGPLQENDSEGDVVVLFTLNGKTSVFVWFLSIFA
jgi:hypothetical protein